MNIRISKYELFEIGGMNVLMSEKGLSTITSPSLLEVLKELGPYMDVAVPLATLQEQLQKRSINTIEAMAFLNRHLNISEMPKVVPFEKIVIGYQDDEMFPLSIIKEEIIKKHLTNKT
jgi:McbB family protein